MQRNRMTWMAALLGSVAITGMMGCGKDQALIQSTKGAAAISIKADLTRTDIDHVTVYVYSVKSGIPNGLSFPMVGSPDKSQYTVVISSLSANDDYKFLASAVNASSVEIFHGEVSNQTIVLNQTAQIVLDMNQVAAPNPLSDEAPVIDWISATGQCAPMGGTVVLKAQAHDPDGASDTAGIGWAWDVTCGALAAAPTNSVDPANAWSQSTDTFTAPNVDSSCTVNITASDARFPAYLQTKASYTINVGGACDKGNAKISAFPNVCPVIQDLRATPVPLNVGVATTLTVTSTDADQDAMTYAWTSDCTGTFSPSAAVSNPTFTLTTAPTSLNCGFNVVVTDGTWQQGNLQGQTKCSISNHLSMPVYNPAQAPIQGCTYGYDYMSNDIITTGDVVTLEIVGPSTGCAGGWTTTWSSSDGATLTPIAAPVAPFTTGVTYPAPAGAENLATPVVVTVHSTCLGSTQLPVCDHTFTLVPKNSFCFGKANGTVCASADLCLQGTTCQNNACVGTAKTCDQGGVDQCKINKCDSTTGNCGVVAKPDNTTCSDGANCTTGDICTNGTCAGTAKTCDQTGVAQCKVNACLESTGLCTAGNAANGTLCTDSNGCTGTSTGPGTPGTTADACSAGACVSGSAVTCAAGNTCHSTGDSSYTCPILVCLAPDFAVKTAPALASVALAPDGSAAWTTGSIYSSAGSFNFGAGTVTSSGSADVYLNKVSTTTGLATQSYVFGYAGGADQTGALVSVSGGTTNNVLVAGVYITEVDIDPVLNPKADTGVQNVDYISGSSLVSGAPMNYYMVIDAANSPQSSGEAKPLKGHPLDLGTGAILAVASNPSQSKFAICGKTSRDPGTYNATNTSNTGVRTTGAPQTAAGGAMDIVVATIDATSGNINWGRIYGGLGDQVCQSIAMDATGNVYIGGYFNGTLDFGGTATGHLIGSVAVSPTLGLPFVAKLDNTGAFVTGTTWGVSGSNYVNAIAVDSAGNVIIGGAIATGVLANFGGTVGTLDSNGKSDAFLVKLGTDLKTPVCGLQFGDPASPATPYDQAIQALAVDSSNNIVVSGAFSGPLGLQSKTGSLASLDAFSARFSSNCVASCVVTWGDDTGTQQATNMTMAGGPQVLIGGNFSGAETITNESKLGGASYVDLTTGGAGTSNGYLTSLR